MFPGARREEIVIATKVFNPVDMAFEGLHSASFRRRPNRPPSSGLVCWYQQGWLWGGPVAADGYGCCARSSQYGG
jgi:hypothetical protein